MADLAIQVEHIFKSYVIHHNQANSPAVAPILKHPFASLGRARRPTRSRKELFYALQDISLEIKTGEVVGLVGRNGSGKSTLLKVLSRITRPSSGRVNIHGRVASLLEVGTGFHPELTGRENIYLGGAIHGMNKHEINRKLDAIIAFSGNEKFIDTPVKRYSSGMYVRLGFAVAAHVEPEILLVDEILAVGDMQFQKKCLSKMQDVGKEGRTVVFVSHNVSSITRLCSRAVMLDQGSIFEDGPSQQVVGTYLTRCGNGSAVREWSDTETAPSGEAARLLAVRVRAEDGRIQQSVDIRHAVAVEMEYEVLRLGYHFMASYDFYNANGILLFETVDVDPMWRGRPRPIGRWRSTVIIPGNLLSEGTVFVTASLHTPHPEICHFLEKDVVTFQVVDSIEGDSARGDWGGDFNGAVRPLLNWRTRCLENDAAA
jgi:lipopolysaccharide transport system ATP-binding protein